MNPIEAAVSPLRAEAVARAQQDAQALADRYLATLAAADWNLDTVAPRPRNDMSTVAYRTAQRRRNLFCMISSIDRDRMPAVVRMNTPTIHCRDDAKVATFIQQAMEAAGVAYDAFVA